MSLHPQTDKLHEQHRDDHQNAAYTSMLEHAQDLEKRLRVIQAPADKLAQLLGHARGDYDSRIAAAEESALGVPSDYDKQMVRDIDSALTVYGKAMGRETEPKR
jgi:hypothetical protein